MRSYCVCAFTDVEAVISSTLAKTAGLNPIPTVTEQKTSGKSGVPKEKTVGISVQKGGISRALEELMVQPLLASVSVLILATETVWSILHLDDVNAQ